MGALTLAGHCGGYCRLETAGQEIECNESVSAENGLQFRGEE